MDNPLPAIDNSLSAMLCAETIKSHSHVTLPICLVGRDYYHIRDRNVHHRKRS